MGSPTHPLREQSYVAWASTYKWEHGYGQDHLYAGPVFTHQLSHIWIDFRDVQDAFMRNKGIDYFENSRRATYVEQQDAIHNPLGFKDYGPHCWGITASEPPGPGTIKVNGIERQFFDYTGRGVPYGPDDGTLAPWALVASLPFAPEIVLPALNHCIHQARLTEFNSYGFKASFNPSHPGKVRQSLWLVGFVMALRTQTGAYHPDDRKLSYRLVVAAHAKLPVHRRRIAARGVWWRVVVRPNCKTRIASKKNGPIAKK